MAQALTDIERDLVDEFGNIYEAYGLKRLKGLIVGLLLTKTEPVSLDDMTELLGRSKGPISTSVRELAGIGLIRKVEGPENRRDYYVAHADLFYNNFKFNMATVRKNRLTAERYLARFRADEPIAHEATIANLEQMHAFYSLMESFYENFSTAWEEALSEEPPRQNSSLRTQPWLSQRGKSPG